MADDLASLKSAYHAVKQACAADARSAETARAIGHFATLSLQFLRDRCVPVALVSKVAGKSYLSYSRSGGASMLSRPANVAMMIRTPHTVAAAWRDWDSNRIGNEFRGKLLYTVALAPCLALELFDRQNKKGPATYFECVVGHIFSRCMGANPSRKAILPVCGRQVRLTMDFLFDRSENPKVHLPVKMSTRERVVQAWSHQRLLDGAFGEAVYRAIMVCFAETKLDSRSLEVIEICVPEQWLAYQALLARMERIYYFDVPTRYAVLSKQFPQIITVKPFTEFFQEKATVLAPKNAPAVPLKRPN